MDLTRQNWKGWNPSSDRINGNPDYLLRMDNLYLDEEGIVSLMRGPQDLTGQFSSDPHTVYSTLIDGNKCRYVGLLDGEVLRSKLGDFSDPVSVIDGLGSPGYAAFAGYRGYTLISSLMQRSKDDGTYTYPLGIEQPSAEMTFDVASSPQSNFGFADFTALGSGTVTDIAEGVRITLEKTTPAGYADEFSSWTGTGLSTTAINTLADDKARAEDKFEIEVTIGNSFYIDRIRVEFAFTDYDADGNATDYVYKDFENWEIPQGLEATGKINCYRGDFIRVGTDPGVSWGTADDPTGVKGVKISVVGSGQSDSNEFRNPIFTSSAVGQLNGYYEYCQVNVHRKDAYTAYSQRGPISGPVHVISGRVHVNIQSPVETDGVTGTGGSILHVTEVWIFRRSAFSPSVEDNEFPTKLGQWYRCLVIPLQSDGTAAVDADIDNTSDDILLLENFVYKEGMISVRHNDAYLPDQIPGFQSDPMQKCGDQIEMNEEFVCIEPEFNGRVCYLTRNFLHFSMLDNPEGIDIALSIGFGREHFQQNLFVRRLQSDLLLLGTTTDIYEISGTLQMLADGTHDMRVRPLEVMNPPVSSQCLVYEGGLYYVAADGIRAQGGSSNILISEQLNRLFEGHTCHDLAPIRLEYMASSNYPICVAKHKLWVGLPQRDGTYGIFVYCFKNKYWTYHTQGVSSLWAEDDDKILAGYRGEGDRVLRLLEESDSTGQNLRLDTVFDCNGAPRNRKDLFSFGIKADTAGQTITIQIAKDGSNVYTTIGNLIFNGPEEQICTIAETIGLAKHIAVRIYAENVTYFKLYRFSIEYDQRPEQLTYLRIPYTNLNTQSRKRFINYAFMIDTLGVDTEFFPLIDGSVFSPTSIVNIDRKGTHVHYFDTEAVGTDIGGILCGFFEFYGINIEETVSEKMPQPATWLRIPQSDYGVPNRKRHSSYKFLINTRGSTVRFTPRVDGTAYATMDFSTSEKQVVEYFFSVDTIGINIGGTLQSTTDPKVPFEFYGPIVPQQVEQLPPRLKEFRIPENNYGIAARKRIRTMPMEINTNGSDVTFTPIIDNVAGTPTVLNTAVRQTAFHYFITDAFGIDYSGELIGTEPFEFYGLMKPNVVEVLPEGKMFDQIGPIRFDKIAKILAVRIRLIATASEALVVRILNDEQLCLPQSDTAEEYQGQINVVANKDQIYEFATPKTTHGTIFRVEIGPATAPFHRYDIQLKLVTAGMDTDAKWVTYGNQAN